MGNPPLAPYVPISLIAAVFFESVVLINAEFCEIFFLIVAIFRVTSLYESWKSLGRCRVLLNTAAIVVVLFEALVAVVFEIFLMIVTVLRVFYTF